MIHLGLWIPTWAPAFLTLYLMITPCYAQNVVIDLPSPDQQFCAMEPFDIPVLGRVFSSQNPSNECQGIEISWSITIEGTEYTSTTRSGEQGMIHVTNPPTQDSSFGGVQVKAEAMLGSQQFFGTGRYIGTGALNLLVVEPGENLEGYVVPNCDDSEQDMVIGERTDVFQAGANALIRGYCTDRHGGVPGPGRLFGAPFTSESTSHWAYWERQVVIHANERNMDDGAISDAIWYISDRSGAYNQILSEIGYPPNGPTKNFERDVTPPTRPVVMDDGDTTQVSIELHATWISEEPESGITEYQFAIGTSPGATDVVDWTSAGGVPEVTHTGLFLSEGTYYFAVKARNGAGLWSEPGFSDGIFVIESDFGEQAVYNFPNPFSPASGEVTEIAFFTRTAGSVRMKIYDISGQLVWHTELMARAGRNFIAWDGKNVAGATVANGVYFYAVEYEGKSVVKKIAVLQ